MFPKKTFLILTIFTYIFLNCPLNCLLLSINISVAADIRRPLLQDGAKTLYQRVISHPGATLATRPGDAPSQNLRSFTPLYVYNRVNLGNDLWLEVSPSSRNAENAGWLLASQCSTWNKALTLLFSERLGRDPVMFFREHKDLDNLVRSENMRASLDNLFKTSSASNSPLLAVEPKEASIPQKRFYLMPIFNYSDEYEQHNLRLLQVGVVDPGNMSNISANPVVNTGNSANNRQMAGNAQKGKFAANIAFIIDTTISMGPYIEQTKQFVKEVYNSIAANPETAEDIALAVVAYRNSTKHNPKIGYVSEVVSDFASVTNRARAEAKINAMAEATVSTHAFNEDAFAGIKTAIDNLSWQEDSIKTAVLVTDAGAIRNNDPLSGTKLNENEIADLLLQKGIRLIVIHLKTALGKKNNIAGVTNQYRQLTALRDGKIKSAYLELDVNNPKLASQQFANIATKLISVLHTVVQKAKANQITAPKPQPTKTDAESKITYLGEAIGYAAYLEFKGKRDNINAPTLVDAWVVDKDLADLVDGKATEALVPAVLLNKYQLNTLAKQIGILLDAALASRSQDSKELFQRMISLSAQTLRDPERLQNQASDNLASLGLLPEFLNGLPYKSQVLGLNEERWFAMSAREQDELLLSLASKMRLYTDYHNDTDNWLTFGASDPGEALYRVPLTSLP